MVGDRWRIVDEIDGKIHVSSVVLAEHEVGECLALEATLHSQGGWTVTVGRNQIVCRRIDNGMVRTVKAVRFDPMDDLR